MRRDLLSRLTALEACNGPKARPMTAFVIWGRNANEAAATLTHAIEVGAVKKGEPVILGCGRFRQAPEPRWTDALGMSTEELEQLSASASTTAPYSFPAGVLTMTDAELSNTIIREAARAA